MKLATDVWREWPCVLEVWSTWDGMQEGRLKLTFESTRERLSFAGRISAALAIIDLRTELSSSIIELFEFAREWVCECNGGGMMSESISCSRSKLNEVTETCGKGFLLNLNEQLRWLSDSLDCIDD